MAELRFPYFSQLWYSYPFARNVTNKTVSAATLYFTPFVVFHKTTFDAIGCRIVTGVALSTGQLGVYSIRHDGLPRGLIYATPSFATTGTANITQVAYLSLNPGCYMLASLFSGAVTVAAGRYTDGPLVGSGAIQPFSANVGLNDFVNTYTALPSTLDSAASLGVDTTAVHVMMRAL